MALFDFARAGAMRQPMAPSSVNHSTLPHSRARPRAALGAPGTLLVLMGLAIGVLTIRFISSSRTPSYSQRSEQIEPNTRRRRENAIPSGTKILS